MKRKKDTSSTAATNSAEVKGKKNEKKGGYYFVYIFGFYFIIAMLILGGFTWWRLANKSPFTHTVKTTIKSPYARVSVVDDFKGKASMRVLTYDKSILGGYWNVAGKPSCFTAFDVMELALYAQSNPKTALIVGLGTGFVGKRCEASGIMADVVELDPVVVHAARHYFSFTTKGKIYTEDATDFIERPEVLNSHKYDIILHDLFSGGIDTSLFTVDVLKNFETLLRQDGVFALNFVGYPMGKASKSVYNTLSSIYENVRCFVDQKVDVSEPNVPLTNIVYFASHKPVNFLIPPHYSKDAPLYSNEWIFTHHKELELTFPQKTTPVLKSEPLVLTEEDGPILNSSNHQVLSFTDDMKSEFWLTMLGLFEQAVWDDILTRPLSV